MRDCAATVRPRYASSMVSRLLLALMLAACSRTVQAPAAAQAPAPQAQAPEPRVVLREEARTLVERHCGECHVGTRPTARPGALAVFDLTEQDWSARMSARQLGSLQRRIGGRRSPSEGTTPQVTELEWGHLQAYVTQEQARRVASAHGAAQP